MLSDTAPVCPHCGMEVRHCTKCGALLPAGAKVCTNCGTPVPPRADRDVEKTDGKRKARSGHYLTKAFLVLFAVLVLYLLTHVPNERKHEAAVSRVVAEAVEDITDSLGGGEDGVMPMSGMIGRISADLISKSLTVDNYWLFSVGRMEYEGKKHVVTFGIAGHVFCFFNKEDVKKMVYRWLDENSKNKDFSVSDILGKMGSYLLNALFHSD